MTALLETTVRDVPVTVTLKAETLAHLMVASIALPDVDRTEFETMARALKAALIKDGG